MDRNFFAGKAVTKPPIERLPKPGIYAAPERWLSDEKIENIALEVKSDRKFWQRFSGIGNDEWLPDDVEEDVKQKIREIVERDQLFAAEDSLDIICLLRGWANDQQASR